MSTQGSGNSVEKPSKVEKVAGQILLPEFTAPPKPTDGLTGSRSCSARTVDVGDELIYLSSLKYFELTNSFRPITLGGLS